MEGSDATQAPPLEEHVSVFDQEPISEHDGHGSVQPTSPPPPSRLSGDPLDAATKAAIAGQPIAQGESSPPSRD